MKVLTVAAVLLWAAGERCTAQEELPDTVRSIHAIGFGAAVNQMKEENLLPRVHSGFLVDLSYEYRRFGERYQNVQIALGFSRLSAEPEDLAATASILINASYAYDFRLVEKEDLIFLLGPEARLLYSVTLFPKWDDSHLYWASLWSMGPNAVALFGLKSRSRIAVRLSLPIISLYSRPPADRLYKMDEGSFDQVVRSLHSDLRLGAWNAFFYLHLEVEYQFPVFQHSEEAISYSLDRLWIRRDDGNPFSQLIHQIALKVML